MALSVSGEFEIEASPEQVMAALVDVERIPEWSAVHKKVVVESRFDDGRPRTVRMTLAVLGVSDTQLAEHKWIGDEHMSWTLLESEKQKCQEGEYRLVPTPRGRRFSSRWQWNRRCGCRSPCCVRGRSRPCA